MARSARLQGWAEREGLAASARALARWQKRRLSRTYADFSSSERYRLATRFFTEELYAPDNLARRDRDIHAMTPSMVRLLPQAAVETVADALNLQVRSLVLDLRLARELARRGIDPAAMAETDYVAGYLAVGVRGWRERQITLLLSVGWRLESLVHRPLIYQALRMARWPAQLAGLGELQAFLEHGFEAFRAMHGADRFLAAIEEREMAIVERIFGGHPEPLSCQRANR